MDGCVLHCAAFMGWGLFRCMTVLVRDMALRVD